MKSYNLMMFGENIFIDGSFTVYNFVITSYINEKLQKNINNVYETSFVLEMK